jgi:hypothetical protein
MAYNWLATYAPGQFEAEGGGREERSAKFVGGKGWGGGVKARLR